MTNQETNENINIESQREATPETPESIKKPKTLLELSQGRTIAKYKEAWRDLKKKHRDGEIDDDRFEELKFQLDQLSLKESNIEITKSPEYVSEADGVEFLKSLIELSGYVPRRDGTDILKSLGGLEGVESENLRKSIIERLGPQEYANALLEGLAGVDTDFAWQIREEFKDVDSYHLGIACSLAGLDTERAWQMRREVLKIDEINETYTIQNTCMNGLDTTEAWEYRNKRLDHMIEKNKVNSLIGMAIGLAGLDSAQAWQMRKKIIEQDSDGSYEMTKYILQGLAGVDSKLAWEYRTKYAAEDPVTMLLSIGGLDSSEAWDIREKYQDSYSNMVLQSLAGLDDERAWETRRETAESRTSPGEPLIQSVFGRNTFNPRVMLKHRQDVIFN